jgi:hypothetical protein
MGLRAFLVTGDVRLVPPAVLANAFGSQSLLAVSPSVSAPKTA